MAIQDKFNKPNHIYKITKDIDLEGQTLTIPNGCTLDFQGGSFSNGTIVGNSTSIIGNDYNIFNNIIFNGIIKGRISCTMFGASSSKSKQENMNIIKHAIKQVDNSGGGELFIPKSINYGYKKNDLSTLPYVDVNNDIVIIDESEGNTYEAPSKDGSQIRYFYMTGENNNQHDSGGNYIRATHHPYMFLSNDKDANDADNRRATYFVGNNGNICWGIGQGTNTIESDGTNRDEELSDFKIVGNNIAGGKGLTNVMVISKNSGKIGFNIQNPTNDFHLKTREIENTNGASIFIDASNRNNELELLLKIGSTLKRIGVSNKNKNLYIVDNSSIILNISPNGDIVSKNKLGIYFGEGNPNGKLECGIGSIYQDRTPKNNSQGLYVCVDDVNKKFNLLCGLDSNTTSNRPTKVPIGFQYFDTTLNKPIWWTGSKWVDATGADV